MNLSRFPWDCGECLQEHLMNTPRQILMYEALGLKVGYEPFILAIVSISLTKGPLTVDIGVPLVVQYSP